MTAELVNSVKDLNKLIVDYREENEKALKQNATDSAELKEKNEKMFNEFKMLSEKQEEIEKNQAEINKNIEIIQAFQNAAPSEQVKTAEKEKCLNALKDLMLNSSGREDFMGKARELNLISTDSNPDGGYAVIPQLEGLKVARFFETSDVRAVANVQNTSSNRVKIDMDEDEADASRTAERSAASNTDTPEIKELFIDIHKYDAEPGVTVESLEDMYFDVEGWLKRKAFDKISRIQNTDFVSGAGVNGARGFLSYTAWTTEGTYEYGKVEQLAGGTSADFTADELIKLVGKLKSPYVNSNTVMAMNRATFFNKMLLKKNGFGDYLFLDSLKDAMSGMKFLGIPIKMWDDMPDVASSALAIAVGDFKQGYDIRDKPGMRFIRDMFTDKSKVKLYVGVRTGGGVSNFEAIKILKCGA